MEINIEGKKLIKLLIDNKILIPKMVVKDIYQKD